jgi:hypothetical protein
VTFDPGRFLARYYAGPDRVNSRMWVEEPLLDPEPFAALAGCHVEDLVPVYARDRERLIWDGAD